MLAIAAEGLVEGTIYKFRTRAENALGSTYGQSDPSDVTLVALISVPAAVPTPQRVEADSTTTSITISWTDMQPVTATDGATITGYRVYAAQGQSSIYTLVHDGAGFPQTMRTTLKGLTTGTVWDFKVSAINFNGEGAQSATALRTYACVAPSGVPAPIRDVVLSTDTSMTLDWLAPTSNGGCPITGYALYRNDPALSNPSTGAETWTEVAPGIRNQP